MWPLFWGAFPSKKVSKDSTPSSTSCKSLFRKRKGDPFRLTPMLQKRSAHVNIIGNMVLCSRNMISLCMTIHDMTLTKSHCEASCAHGVVALSISKEMCFQYVPKRCRDKRPPVHRGSFSHVVWQPTGGQDTSDVPTREVRAPSEEVLHCILAD